jgi:hypothetical protein
MRETTQLIHSLSYLETRIWNRADGVQGSIPDQASKIFSESVIPIYSLRFLFHVSLELSVTISRKIRKRNHWLEPLRTDEQPDVVSRTKESDIRYCWGRSVSDLGIGNRCGVWRAWIGCHCCCPGGRPTARHEIKRQIHSGRC